jgi:hypothetical protein
VLTTVLALHLAGVLALDVTAFAVLACCLRVREAHGHVPGAERALLIAAGLAIALTGVVGRDLALVAVVDLAVLGAAGGPALTRGSRI